MSVSVHLLSERSRSVEIEDEDGDKIGLEIRPSGLFFPNQSLDNGVVVSIADLELLLETMRVVLAKRSDDD